MCVYGLRASQQSRLLYPHLVLQAQRRVRRRAPTCGGVSHGGNGVPPRIAQSANVGQAHLPRISERTTLYISDRDRALEASHSIRRLERVGLALPVEVVDGIDTVKLPEWICPSSGAVTSPGSTASSATCTNCCTRLPPRSRGCACTRGKPRRTTLLGACPRIRVRNPQSLVTKQLASFEPN